MAEWPLSTPAYIRLDLFPANVSVVDDGQTRPPGTDRARVVLTNRDLYVFLDSPEGPACTVSGAIEDAYGDNRNGYTVQLDDGSTFFITRSNNCGCGSRLRGFRPFPGVSQRASSKL